MRLPRLVIAAAASGQGKTTITAGLLAALTRAGHEVAAAKVGPDYIDPGYHSLATGRPGRNLDPWLQGEERILPLLAHAALTPTLADLTVIEGVMGLYDGRLASDGWSSTAHIARLTQSPIVVILDISSAARTVAATVLGLREFDPTITLAGVILNKAGSQRHADEVRRSIEQLGVRVLGVLPRDTGVSAPSRHLGLVPVAERPEAQRALDRLAEQTAELIDLDAIIEIASAAPDLDVDPWSPPVRANASGRIVAVAGGRAFTFRYSETDELLRAQGLVPVVVDPAGDTSLPAGTAGLYLGGGFPEVHAGSLSGNRALLSEIREAIAAGLPTVAECAGLLYLAQAVDGHPMVGAVPATAAMHPRLVLRYREARGPKDTLLTRAGELVRGHEFHRTRTTPGHGANAAWAFDGSDDLEGWSLDPAGTGSPTLHASYLHTHWAGNPVMAQRFADAVEASVVLTGTSTDVPRLRQHPHALGPATDPEMPVELLDHHGDQEVGGELVDLAVNVRLTEPPRWLADLLHDGIGRLAAYPSPAAARVAIAVRHAVPPECVLPTAGAAEAFSLLAQALAPRHAVIVHPQFTEPEAALRRVGIVPDRVILDASVGFTLDPAAVPGAADLVVVGNPTNPTGVLHPRGTLEALRRPGRVLVVDEAFMDTIEGEPDSLIGTGLSGLLVTRSLTKTWGLAGLRAGYVVGDPTLIDRLARLQVPWSVGTLAGLVMEATATPAAIAEADAGARTLTADRAHLVAGLEDLGLRPVDSRSSFVLVDVGVGVRESLRAQGFAVRRGDTFPGLGPSWIRIAVRDRDTTDRLLEALAVTLDAQERTA